MQQSVLNGVQPDRLRRAANPAKPVLARMCRSAESVRTDSPPSRVAIGVILGLGLLGYAHTWQAPFVYDDLLAIPQNPTIHDLWPLHRVLWPTAGGGLTVSGRPILNLSFALNYAVSGTQVWSYHVVNTLIHAAAGLLLFGILRRTFGRRQAAGATESAGNARGGATLLALAVAALWTVHPLQTQAVTYTVQRAESLMGLFYLLTLYAFIRAIDCPSARAPDRERKRWLIGSVASCALGMGTKEVMVTAPLMVLLYDRAFVGGSLAAAWRQRRAYYLSLGATWILLGLLVASTGGNRGGTVGLGVGLPLWAYPLTQFEAIARYLLLAVWPHPLVFEYGTFWVKSWTDLWPWAALVLPCAAAAAYALWRHPAAGFLGAWFFGILAPTSLAPGTIQMIVEHRMYLPLAAVLAGLGWLVGRGQGRRGLAFLGLVGLVWLALTVLRNRDYRSPLALWDDTVAKRPQNPRATEGLAEALAAAGRLDEAIAMRRESVRLLPDEAHYHHNLASTLADAGQVDGAVRHYRLALRLKPDEARPHNNLAILLARLGQDAEAIHHYKTAIRLQPKEPLYPYNLGITLSRLGRLTEAAASYRAAIRLQSDHVDAHFNLASTLVHLGSLPEALEHYAAAQRGKPADAEIATNFGNALLLAGRPTEALAQFQAVLTRQPNDPGANYGAANALAALQRPAEAIPLYERCLQVDPRHANAHFRLGNALLDLDRSPAAIPHLEAAIQLTPNDAEMHHNLGIAYARLERWDDARRAFDLALRLQPDFPAARKNREQLRQVTGR